MNVSLSLITLFYSFVTELVAFDLQENGDGNHGDCCWRRCASVLHTEVETTRRSISREWSRRTRSGCIQTYSFWEESSLAEACAGPCDMVRDNINLIGDLTIHLLRDIGEMAYWGSGLWHQLFIEEAGITLSSFFFFFFFLNVISSEFLDHCHCSMRFLLVRPLCTLVGTCLVTQFFSRAHIQFPSRPRQQLWYRAKCRLLLFVLLICKC